MSSSSSSSSGSGSFFFSSAGAAPLLQLHFEFYLVFQHLCSLILIFDIFDDDFLGTTLISEPIRTHYMDILTLLMKFSVCSTSYNGSKLCWGMYKSFHTPDMDTLQAGGRL